ncbi:hypothetical protein AWENTII_010779 [Aspergillus wentii]
MPRVISQYNYTSSVIKISIVQHLANIPFYGDRTTFKWVRMVGHFKTKMPDANLGLRPSSPETMGSARPIVKRIGFAMTGEMLAAYSMSTENGGVVVPAGCWDQPRRCN